MSAKDQAPSERLKALISARGYNGGVEPLVLVTREEFFTGNDDEGSIGPNLMDHPGVGVFARTFAELAARPDVDGVYFVVTDLNEGDPDLFPFTDTALIVTSAPPEAFADAAETLSADEIGRWSGGFRNPPHVPLGYHLVHFWWD